MSGNPEIALPSLRVLVADDDRDHRMITISALRKALREFYEVTFTEAPDGTAALAEVERGAAELVFLDNRMPGMTGLELLAELQRRNSCVPVVLMTSQNDRATLLEAMRLGASDFLGKDEMDQTRLFHVVRSSLERAQLRTDNLRSHKLAAIGTLAGGIAHEFNNILQVVLGHSQYALSREDTARWKKALEYCRDAAEKGARIVRQLLTFARKSPSARIRFSLADAAREAINMDEEGARKDNVAVRLETRDNAPVVGDQGQLVQVLLNLLTNARHACTASVNFGPEGRGHITVIVESDRHNSRVSVRDNGTGIAPAALPRLFEPFFTTKGSLGGRIYDGKSHGTGLGLCISATIAADHGGRIDVASKQGEGSTFTLVLPRAEPANDDQTTRISRRGPDVASGPVATAVLGRRVLIVDDEALIAELLANYLTEKGLRCDFAIDSRQAQQMAAETPYELLLLDLSLPGDISGKELLQRIRKAGGPNRETRALAMTGHAASDEDRELFEAGFRGIVRKPFEIREMGRLIAETLQV